MNKEQSLLEALYSSVEIVEGREFADWLRTRPASAEWLRTHRDDPDVDMAAYADSKVRW